LFAPIYLDAVEIADMIAAPICRRLACGDDLGLQRFLNEFLRRIGQLDYEPQGQNYPLAHWIENDCWRTPTAPPRTFPDVPGRRRPSHLNTPHQMSRTRHHKSKEWFSSSSEAPAAPSSSTTAPFTPSSPSNGTERAGWKGQILITPTHHRPGSKHPNSSAEIRIATTLFTPHGEIPSEVPAGWRLCGWLSC
jgi:hypothetical protein